VHCHQNFGGQYIDVGVVEIRHPHTVTAAVATPNRISLQ
jgi:hypothetical protein